MAKVIEWQVSGRRTTKEGQSIPFRSTVEATSGKKAKAEYVKSLKPNGGDLISINAVPLASVRELKNNADKKEKAAMIPSPNWKLEGVELPKIVNLDGEDFVNVNQLIALMRHGKTARRR